MRLKRWFLAAIALCAVILAATADAYVRRFALTGVTFTDGGTATGTIDYDTVALTAVGWSITTAGGDTTTFPPLVYSPANSYVSTGTFLGHEPTFTFALSVEPRRDFRITPASSLALATASVPVDLTTPQSSGGLECFNCTPWRPITAGEFDPPVNVPVLSGTGLAGLLLAIAAVGALLLVRRRLA